MFPLIGAVCPVKATGSTCPTVFVLSGGQMPKIYTCLKCIYVSNQPNINVDGQSPSYHSTQMQTQMIGTSIHSQQHLNVYLMGPWTLGAENRPEPTGKKNNKYS